jgi:outer membrane phospholipase A
MRTDLPVHSVKFFTGSGNSLISYQNYLGRYGTGVENEKLIILKFY